jgi:hypothetical protein
MVRPDGTLELSQPIALPPGEVQVTVQPVAAALQSKGKPDACAVLDRICAQRRSLEISGRTREQIDADVRAMRDEWDERQEGLERIQKDARQSRE